MYIYAKMTNMNTIKIREQTFKDPPKNFFRRPAAGDLT
jgi:hypothetical protein